MGSSQIERNSICDSLLKRNETDPFLKRIITGDEKWVVYDNIVKKRSWSKRHEHAQSTAKADIHQKKVMLSVWWDFKGILYFELLARNQTINSNVYCRQLMKLDKQIKQKWPELATRKDIIFHHDNARQHTYLVTRKKLFKFFASKKQTFYGRGSMKLTKRWQSVIEKNVQYIID